MSSTFGRKVLLVSPQSQLRRRLRVMLNRHRWSLVECRSPEQVAELERSERPEAILLDSCGQAWAAAETTRFIRARSALPLIALVAPDDEKQNEAALEAGADAWIAASGSREMLAQLRAILERTERAPAQTPPDAVHAGALEVDFVARKVRLCGKRVHVTPTECKLLRVLLASAGRIVTYERLLSEVWGQAAIQSVERLRIHMKQLQRKFELAPAFAPYLVAEPAVGYRLWVPA